MSILSAIYAKEFLTHAAKLLAASAYADYCDEHPDDETLDRASMGADWMDTLPDAGTWMLLAADVAETVRMCHPDYAPKPADAEKPEDEDELRRIYAPKVCARDALVRLVADTILLNAPRPWDPENPDYRSLLETPVPARSGVYAGIVEFLASGFAHAMIGSGCGIEDYGWEWPPHVEAAVRGQYYHFDYADILPQTEDDE
jgi:hypothetical protein